MTKEIANRLRANYEYFSAFNKIIVYYDYGQIELAQILVSVFNTMFLNVEFRKIDTNQYKLSQAADLICTVEAIAQKKVLTKSENDFFHSKNDFRTVSYTHLDVYKRQPQNCGIPHVSVSQYTTKRRSKKPVFAFSQRKRDITFSDDDIPL